MILSKLEQIYRALTYFEPLETKCIIIGQDCYPNADYACSLVFSTETKEIPASLRNIFKELESDTGIKATNGNLESWAKHRGLLLNSILTAEEGKPLSHANKGWEEITTEIIQRALDLRHHHN
jgi:uracil-DNA glycosylase